MQLQQPNWAVTKEIADTMAGCVHCHYGNGGWFFVDPPHETVREDLWLWVMFSSFLVGISKFNTIAKIKNKLSNISSHVLWVYNTPSSHDSDTTKSRILSNFTLVLGIW